MNEPLIWSCFAVAMVGALTWQGTAIGVEAWLRKNDPTFQPPGVLSRLFLGRLFTVFPQMKTYKQIREERGESTTAVTVFWVGFIAALVGLLAFLASLSTL